MDTAARYTGEDCNTAGYGNERGRRDKGKR